MIKKTDKVSGRPRRGDVTTVRNVTEARGEQVTIAAIGVVLNRGHLAIFIGSHRENGASENRTDVGNGKTGRKGTGSHPETL